MPKMKSHSGLKKRLKRTGSGKLKRSHAYVSHLSHNKTHKQKKHLAKATLVSASDYKRKKVLKLAKGYFGSKHTLYKTAHEQVMHSLAYSYRDRRQVKRDMRKLWIARINAAARLNDISYSKLMHGLKLANVEVNRKMLSEIAICDPKGFTAIVNTAKKALAK